MGEIDAADRVLIVVRKSGVPQRYTMPADTAHRGASPPEELQACPLPPGSEQHFGEFEDDVPNLTILRLPRSSFRTPE